MNWSAEQQRLLGAMGFELRQRVSAGAAFAAPAPIETTAPANQAGANQVDFSRLLQALHRAAGGRDASSLIEDLARLRREPALKRALWPSLRALRRSH